MAIYTLKDAAGELVRKVIEEVAEAARQRELRAETNLGCEAPGTIWDLGDALWEPGLRHLPPTWVNEVCPKDLGLKTAPTLNVYRALVEQIQGGVVSAMPGLEFAADGADARVGALLNDAWRDVAERSRLLAELDLCVQHNCNYGAGWLGIHRSASGEPYIRAVHPQLVVFDPCAERPQDLAWAAKLFVENVGARSDALAALDQIRWPETILPRPENSEVRIELWVKKGAKFAGRRFEDAGLRAVVSSSGKVIEEEDWPHDSLPLVPVYLLPSDRMTGHSLAAVLWQAQVRVDKILAVMLSRTARAAGEKYRIGARPDTIAGVGLTGRADADLRKPGVQVITSDVPIEMYAPPPVPMDLVALLREAIADMERLAGVSQPYQGIAPRGVTAGIAITTLAGLSSRRVNRMATHLAEALRDFGRAWAGFELARRGLSAPAGIRVKVSLEVQQEETRRRQFDAVLELARAGLDIPASVLVELVPGISHEKKREIIGNLSSRQMRLDIPRPTREARAPALDALPVPSASAPAHVADDVSPALETAEAALPPHAAPAL